MALKLVGLDCCGEGEPTSLWGMGQPVLVIQKPSATPGRIRFEINRTLTGMGHEQYKSGVAVAGTKPADVLAQRMLATGHVSAVHVFGNMITVDLLDGANHSGLITIVEDLYQYWKPGMEPPSIDDLMKQVPASATPVAPIADDGGVPLSAEASKIPAALLARSQAALAKARANG